MNTGASRHPILRVLGLIAVIISAPLVVRLVYEQTVLTWHEGWQMVGFSIAHVHPELLIVGGLGLLGLHIFILAWLVSSVAGRVRGRNASMQNITLATVAAVLLLLLYIPYAGWVTLLVRTVGPGEHGDSLLSFAAAEHHLGVAKALLKRGVHIDSSYSGYTALNAACVERDVAMARLLVSNGADIAKAPDCRGIPELIGSPTQN
jgi:hypothetical protein